MALKKFCLHRGCNTLVDSGRCELHANDIQAARQQYDANRPEWHDRYNSVRWRKARRRHLQKHPLCVECMKIGRVIAANVVDHIEDHKGDYDLFWDESNWQGLCEKHHNSKTARTNNRG